MTQNQPRLLLRKHSYYIRIFIPRKLQSVVKRKEIRYSLHTNNYFEALKKLRQEIDVIKPYVKKIDADEIVFNKKVLQLDKKYLRVVKRYMY